MALSSRFLSHVPFIVAILSLMLLMEACTYRDYPLPLAFRTQSGLRISVKSDSLEATVQGKYFLEWDSEVSHVLMDLDSAAIASGEYVMVDVVMEFDSLHFPHGQYEADEALLNIACDEAVHVQDKAISVRNAGNPVHFMHKTLRNKEAEKLEVCFSLILDASKISGMGKRYVRCIVGLPMVEENIRVYFPTELLLANSRASRSAVGRE